MEVVDVMYEVIDNESGERVILTDNEMNVNLSIVQKELDNFENKMDTDAFNFLVYLVDVLGLEEVADYFITEIDKYSTATVEVNGGI